MTIAASHLRKHYGPAASGRDVLKDATLAVSAGKSLAIMGPSGSGKSTLLNILGTLDTPDSGTVEIAGKNPFALKRGELSAFRNRTVGFIFQSHHLLPQCSILENVLVPTLVAPRTKDSEDPLERAKRLIERVGLTARMHARPAALSGGECQRAAVVRALINRPSLLLADEPTGSLDHASAEVVGSLLAEIVREEKVALIAVTHSTELARKMDAIVELREGILEPARP